MSPWINHWPYGERATREHGIGTISGYTTSGLRCWKSWRDNQPWDLYVPSCSPYLPMLLTCKLVWVTALISRYSLWCKWLTCPDLLNVSSPSTSQSPSSSLTSELCKHGLGIAGSDRNGKWSLRAIVHHQPFTSAQMGLSCPSIPILEGASFTGIQSGIFPWLRNTPPLRLSLATSIAILESPHGEYPG
jgi:hypothetical protein